MSNKFINIVGYGYVGGAIGYLCKKNNVGFCTYDVLKKDDSHAIFNFDDLKLLVENSELLNQHNVYFICVPTPPKEETGECDTTIVERVISDLYNTCTKPTSVIIKSTVSPGTTRTFFNKFGSRLNIVFCPEFLKEKTFQEDMYNANFCLLGLNCNDTVKEQVSNTMRHLYKHKNLDVICRGYEECELFKYTINVYLAVKVWYFNEISEVCNKMSVNYNDLQSLFPLEPRIGESHTDAPGHDGLFGFGGKCLPKETLALKHLQDRLGLPNDVLSEILQRNDYFRSK